MDKLKGLLLLIFKCVCVSAPLWGTMFFCRTQLLSIVGTGYVRPLWNRNFTHTTQEKQYDVVIIGDSLANAAYIPEVLSDSAINLALPGSSTADGYYTLVNYLENNPAPKDLFVTYMDYHLEQDTLIWDVGNYVHAFSPEQNQEIFEAIDEYAVEDSVKKWIASDYWKEVYYYRFYTPMKYSHALERFLIENRKAKNEAKYNDIAIRYGRYSAITNDEYDEADDVGYHSFSVSKFNEYYYKKLIDLCAEKDIYIHLIKLPLPENSEYRKEYTSDIWNYYIALLGKCKNRDFRWFHSRYSSEYFMDQYHLNNHGAFRFSRDLKSRYPDVFKDSEKDSPEIMRALDLDVAGENILSELLKWTDDRPYTIVFLDNGVDLAENYYMCLGWSEERDVTSFPQNKSVFYLTADDSDFSDDISVNKLEDREGILVRLTSGEECVLEPTDGVGISFVVIDNVNNTIVCERESLFSDLTFSKIQ